MNYSTLGSKNIKIAERQQKIINDQFWQNPSQSSLTFVQSIGETHRSPPLCVSLWVILIFLNKQRLARKNISQIMPACVLKQIILTNLRNH